MEPLVSVIIAAYNAAPYLEECLESVLAQAGVPFEVIVVDDGSTDGTAEIVRSYPVRYLHQPNSGTCSIPRNNGAREARGEFLVFFDADDVMCQGRLARQAAVLASASSCQIAVCDYRNFVGERDWPSSHFETCMVLQRVALVVVGGDPVVVPARLARRVLTSENFASACGTMVRKEWFQAKGGFNEVLRASEDFDLVFRAALAGDVAVQPFVGFRRRLHDENMSNDSERILRFKAFSRERLVRMEPDRCTRRALLNTAANYRVSLARVLWERDKCAAVNSLGRAVRLRGYPTAAEFRTALAMCLRSLGYARVGSQVAPGARARRSP